MCFDTADITADVTTFCTDFQCFTDVPFELKFILVCVCPYTHPDSLYALKVLENGKSITCKKNVIINSLVFSFFGRASGMHKMHRFQVDAFAMREMLSVVHAAREAIRTISSNCQQTDGCPVTKLYCSISSGYSAGGWLHALHWCGAGGTQLEQRFTFAKSRVQNWK